MEIICLASSSSGNAYVLRNEATTLLVECGLPFRDLKTRLLKHSIVLTRLSACLITHQHGDHAKSAFELSQYCPLLASKETLDAWKIRSRRWPMKSWEYAFVGSFTVMAFEVDHDCEGAYGFIIFDKENNDSTLFINDTKFLRWDLSAYKFGHVMIECNHNDEILDLKDERTKRVANSHMSLRTTLLTLKSLDLENTKDIWLMHLSDGSSDEKKMLEEVAKQTGKPVYACQKEGGVREYGNL